ncbi:MAG: hypothetical protein HC788_06080 [Sphingopyxis sp.]|nr:hypothetical protein [Sphingopyxis sp.]
MGIGHRITGVPPLKEMSASALPPVDALGIARVHRRKYGAQVILRLRDENEMDMIGHQAPGQTPNAAFLTCRSKVAKIVYPVGVREKYVLLPVAALNDVMGDSWHNLASNSRHGSTSEK